MRTRVYALSPQTERKHCIAMLFLCVCVYLSIREMVWHLWKLWCAIVLSCGGFAGWHLISSINFNFECPNWKRAFFFIYCKLTLLCDFFIFAVREQGHAIKALL